MPYRGRQLGVGAGHAMDELLALAAVADDVLDRDDRQRELVGDGLELLGAGHAVALAAADLAQHARRRQAGEARQIDGGLGVAGAAQHAALLRHQRRRDARACGSPRACELGSSIA